MTGLTGEQVTELVAMVHQGVAVWQRPRGRRRVLGLFRSVVLVLFLPRHNNAQDVAAELFGCSQSTVSRRWRALCPLVREVLAELESQVTAQESRSGLLVDGFLAPTGNRAGMSELFSGKRHTAGFNVQAVTSLDGRIVDTGDPQPGARHDSKAFVESGIADRWAGHYAPGGPGMTGDKGYLGCGIITPDRKPPGGELPDGQKAYNTSVNRIRAAAERGIAHIKNWKILKTGYRGRLTEFPDLLRTVTRLEIYRVWW